MCFLLWLHHVIFDVKNLDFSELEYYVKNFFWSWQNENTGNSMTGSNFSFSWRVIYSSMKSQSLRTTGGEDWNKICTIPMAFKLLTEIHRAKCIIPSKSTCNSYVHKYIYIYTNIYNRNKSFPKQYLTLLMQYTLHYSISLVKNVSC